MAKAGKKKNEGRGGRGGVMTDIDVELRDRRPLRVVLDALADLGVLEQLRARVRPVVGVEQQAVGPHGEHPDDCEDRRHHDQRVDADQPPAADLGRPRAGNRRGRRLRRSGGPGPFRQGNAGHGRRAFRSAGTPVARNRHRDSQTREVAW